MKKYCSKCGKELESLALGWRCNNCGIFTDMQGNEHIPKEKPFAPPMPKILSGYNQGYTQALLNLQEHINQDLYDDMRKHKMSFNYKNIQAFIQCFIENRHVLRDFPNAFIRVEKDEKDKPCFKLYIG